MRQSTSLAITLAAFAAQAEAFWGTAHMLSKYINHISTSSD